MLPARGRRLAPVVVSTTWPWPPQVGCPITPPATPPRIVPATELVPTSLLVTTRSLVHSVWVRATASSPLERSEEHTSELQSLMRISYAVFCLKKKKNNKGTQT